MADGRYLPATGRLPLTALYDPVLALTMRERTFRPAVVAAAVKDEPAAILDVGCGTGTLAIALAEAAPDAVVTGVDGDPAILDRARHKATDADASVVFAEGRAERLPFADASFDCVTSTLMLHHLTPEPKRQALREAARVLRPGGRLVIADWGRPRDPVAAAGFLAVRLLDGVAPTRDHAAGRLPELMTATGLTGVHTEQHWRTIWGTLERFTARSPESPNTTHQIREDMTR
ncbi:MAG: class I SAM-dependent methyltransferase [Actinomycetota bacterium]|nr:class I SAM-dependent methyltransferase [Actinomycetota bacterium]